MDEAQPTGAVATNGSLAALENRACLEITWTESRKSFHRYCMESAVRTLRTFGVHYFWARAEGRQRVYDCIRIDGRPLAWTGTGRELMLAFAAVVGTLLALAGAVLIYLFFFAQPPKVKTIQYWRFLIAVPAMFMIGAMVWRRFGHELERTWLQGSPFTLQGTPWRYAWLHFWTAFLIPLTLGWIIPWRTNALHAAKISGVRFGDHRFWYAGKAGPLYRRFAVAWCSIIVIYLVTMVTLGVTIGSEIIAAKESGQWAGLRQPGVAWTGITILAAGISAFGVVAMWYRALALSHYVSSIRINDVALHLILTDRKFLSIAISNMLLKFVTLGLWAPYADARLAKLTVTHLTTWRCEELPPWRLKLAPANAAPSLPKSQLPAPAK